MEVMEVMEVMEEPYALADELNLLAAAETKLYRDEFGDLVLQFAAKEPERGIRVVRCFPISAGDRFIALRTRKNEELGIVADIDELDPTSRATLAEELALAYFRPQITAVYAITEEHHIPRWQVDTDRGPRTFEIRSSRRDIRVLSKGRVLIRDADGNHYEIPNYRQLEPASRALVADQV